MKLAFTSYKIFPFSLVKDFKKSYHSQIVKALKQAWKFERALTLILLSLVTIPFSVFSQTTVTISASGTWTAPNSVTSITVECWGGGGGGSGGRIDRAGAGGGGGAFVRSTFTVVPGTTYNITVGAGGTSGAANGGAGGSGGDSFFNTNTTLLAKGGGGGTNPSGTGTGGITLSGSIGTAPTPYAGGSGAIGEANSNNDRGGGGGGSSGGIGSIGNNGATPSSNSVGGLGGTVTGGGSGGNGGHTSIGFNGLVPGGAGGGGGNQNTNGRAGGSGGAGQVNITYTQPSITSFSPTFACAGSGASVIITGANFTGATPVAFNGVSASFTVNSNTQITATLPASATTGTITVTKGTVATSSTSFTVNARPTPTFTVSPATSICASADVTYTTQSGQTSYVWSVPGVLNTDYTITSGGISTSDNSVILKWLTSGSKTVTVNYTDLNGCTGAAAASSVATVYIPNNTTTGFTGSKICPGGTGQLTFDAANATWSNASNAGSITYRNDATLVQYIQPIPSASAYTFTAGDNPSASSNYTLISITNDIGCVNTTTITNTTAAITVYSLPNNSSDGGFVGSIICAGGTGQLTFDALNSTWSNITNPGSIQYTDGTTTWTQAIPSASAFTFNVAVSPTVTTTYTLVSITNDVGCIRTIDFADASAQIVVNARPTPTFTTSPASSVCASADVTYSTQSGQTNYSWSVPGTLSTDYTITSGGISTSSNTVTLKWLTSGSKTVTVNYTDANGCTGVSAASSNTTVNALPTPTFTSSPSTNSCISSSYAYTTQSGQSSYVWTIPGINGTDYNITSGGVTTETVTIQWLTIGSKTVTVNYTNSAGCTGAAAGSSSTTVNSLPTPTYTAQPGASACISTDVIYTTQAGQSNYIWTVPGVLSTDYTISSGGIGTGSNTVTLKWLTTGSKTVTINYTTSGCTATSATSSTATTVNALPTPTFTAQPSGSYCASVDVTYTTQSGQSNYIWTVPGTLGTDYSITSGGIGTGSNTVTLKWLTAGSKTVTINYTNASGCTAASATSSTATTVNALPTITASASATGVCFSASLQTTPLTYSATSGSPNQYSITWNDSPANSFVAVNATLTAAPSTITISVPAGTSGGIYTGNLTVRNSTTGCVSATTTFTVSVNNDVTGLTASATTAQCSNAGITVTLSSSRLATGTYTVVYQFNGSGGTSSTTMAFTSGTGTGTGTFSTLPSTGVTFVTIKSVTLGSCSATGLTINTNSFTTSAPPDAASNNLTTSASGTNIGNLLGSTVTIISTKLNAETYTVGYTVTDAATNTIVFINSTKSITFVNSKRKRLQGSFTTGQLGTEGNYQVNINSITSQSTGCTADISGEFATFSVVNSIFTLMNGLWDQAGVWSISGDGPDYRSGEITINHQVTYDATSVSIILELDQLIIGSTGELIIASGQEFRLKDGTGVDITIQPGGKLTIGSTTIVSGDPYNGTLVFENGVTHIGTVATFVTFKPNSLYQHLFTTTEGIPPLATWDATSTFSVEGYTTLPVTQFTSAMWSQNFGGFTWNCINQTSDIDLNGKLGNGSIQGNLSFSSTGTGIARLASANAPYSLTIGGDFSINATARYATGPSSGQGPDATLTMQNLIYSSTAVGGSWLCDGGQSIINILQNIQVNNGTLYMSSGGNIDRSGSTINLTGNLTVADGAIFDASDTNNDRIGKIIFTNLTSPGEHQFNTNTTGIVRGQIIYEIAANQIVRAVNESAFVSSRLNSDAFTLSSGARLIVESQNSAGAIQSQPTATPVNGNIKIIDTWRTFQNGSIIEYGTPTSGSATTYIGVAHPIGISPAVVHCIINNSAVNVSTSGAVTVSGNLTLQAGTLNVLTNDLSVTGTTTLSGGSLALNSTGQASGRNVTLQGNVSRTGGAITVTSGSGDSENANINFNGDFLNTGFLSFSGNNCNVLIGGGTLSDYTASFPLSGSDDVESFTMNKTLTEPSASLKIPQQFAVGYAANSSPANGLFITNGNLKMTGAANTALTVNRTTQITTGSLEFKGPYVVTLKEGITSTPTGVFSSDGSSTLIVDGTFNGTNNNLYFLTPGGNTLGTLTLNRTGGAGPHLTLQNALTISNGSGAGTFNLTAGQFYNLTGLNMGNGATIIRTPNSAFTTLPLSLSPTGVSYNVIYNDGTSPTNTSLSPDIEAQGNLNNVTSNLTGSATLTSAITGIGALTINSGTFICNEFNITLGGDFTNNGTFNAGISTGTVIFDGASTIGGSSITNFNYLTLNEAKTLTAPVSAPKHIQVKGNIVFNPNSTFNHSKGNVELNGSVDQNINANNTVTDQTLSMDDGSAPSTAKFHTITVNKTGGAVNLLTDLQLGFLLDIKTPTNVVSNGKLILLSQNKSTHLDASIGPILNGGTVTGAVQVQRFMGSTAYALFRYIASPVQNGAIPTAYVDKLYRYDGVNRTWVRNFGPMIAGEGYAALSYSPSDARWSVTNDIKIGNHSYTAFTKAGWYLLGNPYPSAIQWNGLAAGWDVTWDKVATVIAITDNNISSYPNYFHYYDYASSTNPGWGSSPVKGSGTIAMGQSYWVYALAGGSITVKEPAKKTAANFTTAGQFYRQGGESKSERLAISIDNGIMADQSFLITNPKATKGFDFNLDFPKLWNMDMNVFLVDKSQGDMLMLALSELPEATSIPVGVKVTRSGVYQILLSNEKETGKLSELFLVDKLEGVAMPVSSTEPYTFTITDTSKPVTDRFYLTLNPDSELNKDLIVSVFPNPVKDQLQIQVYGASQNSSVTLMDINGVTLISADFTRMVTVDMLNFTSGMYILKVKTNEGVTTKKIVKE